MFHRLAMMESCQLPRSDHKVPEPMGDNGRQWETRLRNHPEPMERYWKTMRDKVPEPSGTNGKIMKDNGDKVLEPMERYWKRMGWKDSERQWETRFRNPSDPGSLR